MTLKQFYTGKAIGFVALATAVLVIAAVSIWHFYPKASTNSVQPAPLGINDGANVKGFGRFHDSPTTNGRKGFTSDQYGISFTYPSNYFAFDAADTGPNQTNFYGVELLQDSPSFRRAIAGEHSEVGMIPRISVLIYLQNASNMSLEGIAKQRITNASGDNAPIPTFSKITVSGLPAVRYTDTSGLYSRDTVLTRNGEWMVQVSADDATSFKADLDSILSSLTFKSLSDTTSSAFVSVGDMLGAMTVVSVAPFNTGQYSPNPKSMQLGPQNAKIMLKGPIKITGTYSAVHSGIGFDGYCLSVSDAASLARLPVIPVNGVRPDIQVYSFCFRNGEVVRQQLGEESRTVTVTIDNFELNAYPAEVMSWADLVKIQ